MNQAPKTVYHLLLVSLSLASISSADDVDDYVESRMEKAHIPGLSIAVVREGNLIKARGYGLANIELGVPATEHTVYQYASITKPFTAAAILLLQQDGKLKLTDLLIDLLPKIPHAWSNITVRHLLTHTSGIKSYTSLPVFTDHLRKDYTQEEVIHVVSGFPLESSPGEKFAYNNSGYYLLGMIIERLSGQTFNDFLQERIFRPLQMNTARANDRYTVITNRAWGYDFVSNTLVNAEFVSPSLQFSVGVLVGTVLDLARWDAALYTEKILPRSVKEEMWTPVKLNNGKTYPYGYGWRFGEVRGHRAITHSGRNHGFVSYVTRFVDDQLTVIVLVNSMSADPAAIAHGVAARYLPGLLLSTVSPKSDPDPKLTSRLKQCLVDLAEKRDSERITPQFRDDYADSRRRAGDLKQRLGQLKSFAYLTDEPPGADRKERFGVPIARLRHYKMTTDKEDRFYTFELTADNQVAWYDSSDQ